MTAQMQGRRRHPTPHFMDDYHAARQAWILACEAITANYRAEVQDYKLDVPPITFKRWLMESVGMPRR